IVEHRPAGVHARRRRHDLRVEGLGAAFRTEDERLGGRGRGEEGEQEGAGWQLRRHGSVPLYSAAMASVRASPASCFGISMRKVVPAPGRLSTSMRPCSLLVTRL